MSLYKKVWAAFDQKRKVTIENFDYLKPIKDVNEEQIMISALISVLGKESDIANKLNRK